MTELRVYLREKCLLNPDPPVAKAEALFTPLLGLFVPKLIEMAIGGVATMLKKAGEDDTESATGREFSEFYVADDKQSLQVNGQIGSILAVWGVFADEDKEPTDPFDKAVLKLVDDGLVPKNADIGIIFEAAVRPTADETAFYLETRHFSVREFIGDSGKRDRSYVVTLSVTTPGSNAAGDTIALGTIDLGRAKRATNLIPAGGEPGAYPRYFSNLMPWKQISAASKDAYDADVATGSAAGRRYMPVTFNITFTETADGKKFLVKLGELLDGAKEKAAAEISKAILPAEREKAQADKQEAAEKLYDEELTALIAVREAEKALKAGTAEEKPVLAGKLEQKKRALARKKALRVAAGLPDRPEVPST